MDVENAASCDFVFHNAVFGSKFKKPQEFRQCYISGLCAAAGMGCGAATP